MGVEMPYLPSRFWPLSFTAMKGIPPPCQVAVLSLHSIHSLFFQSILSSLTMLNHIFLRYNCTGLNFGKVDVGRYTDVSTRYVRA